MNKHEPAKGQVSEAKLRECPFCNTKRTRIHEWIFGALVLCECGAKGPEGYGESRDVRVPMACDLWNRRAAFVGIDDPEAWVKAHRELVTVAKWMIAEAEGSVGIVNPHPKLQRAIAACEAAEGKLKI